MASAEKLVIEVPVQIVERVTTISLELTEKEATVLGYILGSVGGDPKNSLRPYAESIRCALEEVGFAHFVGDTDECYDYLDGMLRFSQDPALDVDGK
jgi:hypothetical protein